MLITDTSVNLTSPDDGDNTWVAYQNRLDGNLSFPEEANAIDWSYGPITSTGYFDCDTFDFGVDQSVMGIYLGAITGNLKDGVAISIDLFQAKGDIRYYLKNGEEVWIRLNVSIKFDGHFKGDYKLPLYQQ
ncbi:uncharacterized protein ASPGLDRAFT_136626 [Aspergillus glaucus CBS 516.65]|uniref:Uncharacterized protein n=1 Tax=Aspergillus glaucus CBS 516.65 TaxID=1160497 RepID=A0A1L9V6F8_ASPGL|nr:hypothetical protein ASPGLDRAFT_136626 [Aspergillus glaucus CBS 516.65]OJJ79505.1 hypothetical protein ASPGLDRAFT_136626 [Aspergillus glaucus CBS 516.65]